MNFMKMNILKPLIFICITGFYNLISGQNINTNFTIAFGSCDNQEIENKLWDEILKNDPDVKPGDPYAFAGKGTGAPPSSPPRRTFGSPPASVNDLAARARRGALRPHEIRGGTFTVTNFGTFRNLTGTPIINQPESAILGVGAILKKPAVISAGQGDAIAIRHLVILSLSYDHRVIDGALGGRFLQRLADYLEAFDSNRQI
jgi:hypothetical protein